MVCDSTRMTGVELTDRGLVVDREPNRLDELAVGFSEVLRRLDISHVFVAGYVAIPAGRSRSTGVIDVFIERCSAVEPTSKTPHTCTRSSEKRFPAPDSKRGSNGSTSRTVMSDSRTPEEGPVGADDGPE